MNVSELNSFPVLLSKWAEKHKVFFVANSRCEVIDLVKLANGSISSLCRRAFENSKAHGFTHDNPGQAIALMHSELSEALEAMRKPERKDEHLPDMNPVGLELADACIRIFDYCGARGIDLNACILAKMDYNEKRPHKHGGKRF